MWTRLFDEDPLTRTKTYFHHDPDTDRVVMETVQDVEDLIDLNKRLKNTYSDYRPWQTKGDRWHEVGILPLTVYHDLLAKGILDDQNEFRRWWNNPDNPWKAHPGKL